jgi:tetratricopeptide (TPR) repeat protein
MISQGRTAGVDMPDASSRGSILLGLCHNIVFYLSKIVWPTNLSSYYALPNPMTLSHPAILAGVVGTAVLIPVLLVSLRWTRAPMGGWLFFFVVIFPTMGGIGFTQVIAADKYAYLPSVGLLMVLAWSLGKLWGRLPTPAAKAGVCILPAVALTVALSSATRQHLAHWRDTEGLYRYMLTLTPKAATLHSNLGFALSAAGRSDEAIECYQQSLRLRPNHAETCNNLGIAYFHKDQLDKAIACYERTLQINPAYFKAHNNLGNALLAKGKLPEAIAQYRQALRMSPTYANAHYNLGVALANQGQLEQAADEFSRALAINPRSLEAHSNLGIALEYLGQLDGAIEHFRWAVRLRPTDPEVHYRLGVALARAGRSTEAILQFTEALRLKPDHASARAGLSAALQTTTRPQQAP